MKSSAIPAVRVSPDLREAVERALRDGESLSSFVEDSVRRNVEFRQAQKAFVDRALASGVNAKQTGVYVSASETLQKISERIRAAQQKVRAAE